MSKRNSGNTKKQAAKDKAVEAEVTEVKPTLLGKNAIFHMEGGVGKHVAGSAVIASYKKAKPENNIIVVCAWPEVFLNNPHVDRVYRIGNTPHFYKDYIYKQDVDAIFSYTNRMLKYTHKNHIKQQTILQRKSILLIPGVI